MTFLWIKENYKILQIALGYIYSRAICVLLTPPKSELYSWKGEWRFKNCYTMGGRGQSTIFISSLRVHGNFFFSIIRVYSLNSFHIMYVQANFRQSPGIHGSWTPENGKKPLWETSQTPAATGFSRSNFVVNVELDQQRPALLLLPRRQCRPQGGDEAVFLAAAGDQNSQAQERRHCPCPAALSRQDFCFWGGWRRWQSLSSSLANVIKNSLIVKRLEFLDLDPSYKRS